MNYEHDPEATLRSAAYRALSYRPLTAKELRDKLRKRKGVNPQLIDKVVQEIADSRYIDEDAIAEDVIRRGREVKLISRRMLRRDLLKRGIDKYIVENALIEYYSEEQEYEAAMQLARKKLRATHGLPANKRNSRIGGALGRKGFPSYLIAKVLYSINLEDDKFVDDDDE